MKNFQIAEKRRKGYKYRFAVPYQISERQALIFVGRVSVDPLSAYW